MSERERIQWWKQQDGKYATGSKESVLVLAIRTMLENPATRNSYLGTMEAAKKWMKRRESADWRSEPPLEENHHVCIEGCHAAKIDRSWPSFANIMYSIIP